MEREDATEEARRDFIARCGRLALAAPPTLALLLTATDRGYAIAGSLGNPGNNKAVGRAGETPGGGYFGSGDRGRSR